MSRSFRLLDHDPEIDKFKSLWRSQKIKQADLAVLAGLHTATVKNLFSGQTKRPRHTTYAAMAQAMGHEYGLTPVAEIDYSKAIPIARQEKREHLEALATERLVADVTQRKQAAKKKRKAAKANGR
jgi:transcriptional regulator with XRE-family HTH domain